MLYQIRNWNKLFETAETRKLKRLTWVPVPNKHDGKGYRRILRLQEGPLVYAAWILILQVASKCPTRGILADDDGPLTAEDLSDKTGFPVEYFAIALKHLAQKDIGWLECDNHQDNLLEVQENLLEVQGRIEGNRSEENRTTSTPFPAPVNAAPCEVDCHLQQVQGCNTQGDLFENPVHTVQNALDEATASHPPIPVHSPKTEEISHGKALPASVQGKKKRPSNPKPKINAWGAWIDINRENGRKDPVPVGPDTQAGKQLAANLADISELKQIYRNYLDDRDPWLTKQGHPLRLLPGRVNKYANERYGIGIPGEEFMESEAV